MAWQYNLFWWCHYSWVCILMIELVKWLCVTILKYPLLYLQYCSKEMQQKSSPFWPLFLCEFCCICGKKFQPHAYSNFPFPLLFSAKSFILQMGGKWAESSRHSIFCQKIFYQIAIKLFILLNIYIQYY